MPATVANKKVRNITLQQHDVRVYLLVGLHVHPSALTAPWRCEVDAEVNYRSASCRGTLPAYCVLIKCRSSVPTLQHAAGVLGCGEYIYLLCCCKPQNSTSTETSARNLVIWRSATTAPSRKRPAAQGLEKDIRELCLFKGKAVRIMTFIQQVTVHLTAKSGQKPGSIC